MLFFIFCVTIIFSLYLELSDGLGNIWIRKNADGNYKSSLIYLFNFIIRPLFDVNLWNYKIIDTNYFFVLFILLLCIYL